jgi:hypothetical protein
MPYKTQSPDTSPEMEEAFFDLLRRAGTAGRYERMSAWSSSMIDVSRSAIARANPQWSRREVLVEWARLQYGEKVFTELRVRAHYAIRN